VAGRIREAILSGRLKPGARLSVPELARQLGVSRTPVREGLLVLEREGLAVARATPGLAVIAGDAADMRDLLDVREGLEAIAARRAAERMTEAEIAALQAAIETHAAALEAGDLAAHVELDARFHQLVRQGARNPRLERQLTQIEQQGRVLNMALSRARGWSAKAVIRDHAAIAAAIAARDPDAAERALRRHVERTRSFYAAAGPDGADAGDPEDGLLALS
jgi:DNA-binding GntR family transcriptional regulator